MSVFQVRLKKIMEDKNITAAEISRGTGISKSAISKYLSDGNKKACFDSVLRIADYLNVDPSWLGGLVDEIKPFRPPEIVSLYEQLSEEGKRQVFEYARFTLKGEGKGEE